MYIALHFTILELVSKIALTYIFTIKYTEEMYYFHPFFTSI